MAGFWDKEKSIGSAEGNKGKEYRVTVNEKSGRKFVSIKEWWHQEETNEMFPAKKQGINIPEESFGTISSFTA